MFKIIPKTFPFSLYCFDLDETIINNHSKKSDKSLIKRFNSSLKSQRARGAKIIYASARDKKGIMEAIKLHDLIEPDYIITDLGLHIYSLKGRLQKLGHDIKIGNWNSKITESLHKKFRELIVRKPARSSLYKKTYYTKNLDNELVNRIQRYLKRQGQDALVCVSGDNAIYITPKGCSKGAALLFIKKHFKVKSSDVFVSGDSDSDISLFEVVPNSVLVGNAHFAVKEAVRTTIPSVFVSEGKYTEGVLEGVAHFHKVSYSTVLNHLKKTASLFVDGDFKKIISITTRRVKELNRKAPYQVKIIYALLLGHAYEKQGLFASAKKEYIKCVNYSEKIQDLYLKILVSVQLGKIFTSVGKLDKGIGLLKTNLSRCNREDFKYLKIYCLNSLAYANRLKGNLNHASADLKQAQKLSQNTFLYPSVLHNLAGLYRDLKKYQHSLVLYEKILRIANPKDLFFKARIYNNIGFINRRLGSYNKARRYYLNSYKLEKVIGSKQLQGRTLNNLGGVSRMQKDYSSALRYFSSSANLRLKIGDISGLSSSLLNKGIVLNELRRPIDARKFLEQSLVIRRKIGSVHLINEVLDELKKL